MNASIMHIGVFDKEGTAHAVSFKDGVNVITGRSSTGKSALIEIFDYCFGSSEFTVPVGVITDCANIYFTVMRVNESALVLGRRAKESQAFLKEELDIQKVSEIKSLTPEYFHADYFSPLSDFLKEMKRHFGVLVTDIDEDLSVRVWTGRKSSTPSIRSFTSFMLQHQNLVANKHALFYRFDQKEKREQAIDHLKIFLGFADQQYFLKAQELNALQQELRQLERSLPKRSEKIEVAKAKLLNALREYEAISGKALGFDVNTAESHPKATLDTLRITKVYIQDSTAHVRLKNEAEEEERGLVAKLRRKQQELDAVESSIAFSLKYTERNSQTVVPESANVHASVCPFCESHSSEVEDQANQLTDAITWLNSELLRSSYRLESFEEQKKKTQGEIDATKKELSRCRQRIKAIEGQIKDLEKVRSQYELAVEAKIRVESALSEIVEIKRGPTDEDISILKAKIKDLTNYLSSNYNIQQKLSQAQERICTLLEDLGAGFDFEQSYRPIKLRFSIESFDLWHEMAKAKHVFLRSMGSGANWLSCHIVLFLALQRYFCELGRDCTIPPILFFDQPSQVYFPTILDGETAFSPEELAQKDTTRDKSRPVDEDIKAVTNLFEQLVNYCQKTKEITNIMPQIIVTDHADHLNLSGDVPFESLVRKRWRLEGEGFISPNNSTGEKDA